MCFDRVVVPVQSATRSAGRRQVQRTAERPSGPPQGELRRVLLPRQPPVRARSARAVRDLPSQRGAAETAAAAALRVPPGAPRARRVGVPLRAGAGRAARLALTRRAALPRGVYWAARPASFRQRRWQRWQRRTDSARPQTAARAAQQNRYLQRLVEDEELRANLLAAYGAARSAYGRMSNGKPASAGAVRGSQAAARAEGGGERAARSIELAARAAQARASRRRARPLAAAARGRRPCSRSRSARACARRCSTCCSAPRRSSTTARPRLPATPAPGGCRRRLSSGLA